MFDSNSEIMFKFIQTSTKVYLYSYWIHVIAIIKLKHLKLNIRATFISKDMFLGMSKTIHKIKHSSSKHIWQGSQLKNFCYGRLFINPIYPSKDWSARFKI